MGSRFVRPETTILSISKGDTLTVKCRLTAGEQRARFARMSLAGEDGALNLNRLQVGLATVTAYLLDWSLKDDDGKPVRIHGLTVSALESILDNLDMASFTEIRDAIDTHESEMDRASKNGQGGAIESSAILPLPNASAGDTSGSLS